MAKILWHCLFKESRGCVVPVNLLPLLPTLSLLSTIWSRRRPGRQVSCSHSILLGSYGPKYSWTIVCRTLTNPFWRYYHSSRSGSSEPLLKMTCGSCMPFRNSLNFPSYYHNIALSVLSRNLVDNFLFYCLKSSRIVITKTSDDYFLSYNDNLDFWLIITEPLLINYLPFVIP